MYLIDVHEGVSGDMLLSALLHMSRLEPSDIKKKLETAGNVMGETKVELRRCGSGLQLRTYHPAFDNVPGHEMVRYISQAVEKLELSKPGVMLATNIFVDLLAAEGRAHGVRPFDVELHELGNPDTIVDIVGIAYLYEKLRLKKEKIYATPIAIGRGKIRIKHGNFDIPPPGTRELLRGMKYNYGPYDGELATPTGVAALRNLICGQVDTLPENAELVGLGVGTKNFGRHYCRLRIYRCLLF